MPTKPLAQPQRTQSAEEFLASEENRTGLARTSTLTWQAMCEFAEAYAQSLKQAAAPNCDWSHRCIRDCSGTVLHCKSVTISFMVLEPHGELPDTSQIRRWQLADFRKKSSMNWPITRHLIAAKCFGIEGANLMSQVERTPPVAKLQYKT